MAKKNNNNIATINNAWRAMNSALNNADALFTRGYKAEYKAAHYYGVLASANYPLAFAGFNWDKVSDLNAAIDAAHSGKSSVLASIWRYAAPDKNGEIDAAIEGFSPSHIDRVARAVDAKKMSLEDGRAAVLNAFKEHGDALKTVSARNVGSVLNTTDSANAVKKSGRPEKVTTAEAERRRDRRAAAVEALYRLYYKAPYDADVISILNYFDDIVPDNGIRRQFAEAAAENVKTLTYVNAADVANDAKKAAEAEKRAEAEAETRAAEKAAAIRKAEAAAARASADAAEKAEVLAELKK